MHNIFLYVLLDHRPNVLRLERGSGPRVAAEFLVTKMLEDNNAGWFMEFISALESAGKFLVLFLFNTHVHMDRAYGSMRRMNFCSFLLT